MTLIQSLPIMSDEIETDYNQSLFDGIVDFDPEQMCIDDDSTSCVQSIDDWLATLKSVVDEHGNSQVCLSGISLNRKEWLVIDGISRRSRSPRLFEFLILLLNKQHYESYASFIDRSKGIFQIHKPEQVAELWQAVKSRQSNQKMTYDKFARAIRWYYKSNLMQKTNTRYTFQFTSQTLKTYFLDENNNHKNNMFA